MTEQELLNELKRKMMELIMLPTPDTNELKELEIVFDEMAEKLSKLPQHLRMPAVVLLAKTFNKYHIL